MSMIGDILGGVGDVLSAPRRLLYNNIISPLAGREVNGFKDLIGMDDESGFAGDAIGFMGDMLTDPLTYLGGAAATGLRNMAFGKFTTGLGKASGKGSGLLAPAGMKAGAENVPVIWNAGLRSADDIAAKGLNAASLPGPTGLALSGEVSPGAAALGNKTISNRLDSTRRLFDRNPKGLDGFDAAFDSKAKLILSGSKRPDVSLESIDPAAIVGRRHERMHSLIDNAISNPAARAELPLSGRMAASLLGGTNSLGKGVGRILDEVAAYGAQSRGGLQSIQNIGNFLFNPSTNSQYLGQIGAASPTIASLYGTLPSMFPVAGGIGGYGLSSMGR